MKNFMKDKRNIVIVIITIICLFAIITTISYAFIAYNTKQIGTNIIETDCMRIEMEELTNAIRLTNTYPVTDEVGEKTKPFRFKITNTCGVGVNYNVNLEVMGLEDEKSESNPEGTANRIASKNIAVKVDENNKSILNSNTAATPTYQEEDYTAVEAYTVYSGEIKPYESVIHEVRIWLDESAGNDSQNGSFYSKVVIDAIQNQTAYNPDLLDLIEILEIYLKEVDEILATPEDVNKMVTNKEAMELIISSEYLKGAIKSSENYTETIKKQILNSTVISETEKYNAGLPFYLFKNGNTGFTWKVPSDYGYSIWCSFKASDCTNGVATVSNTLYVADNNTSEYSGGRLKTNTLNLSNYQKLTYSYTLKGTVKRTDLSCNLSGVLTWGEEWIHTVRWCNSDQSSTATINISNYSSGYLSVGMNAGGSPQDTLSFSVPVMYVY